MYQLIVDSLLGLSLEVDKLRVNPCLPAEWEGFELDYRYRETVYRIKVRQVPDGHGRTVVLVDGVEQPGQVIPLVNDRREHRVKITKSAVMRAEAAKESTPL